ncbi:MAG: T9SS type A sorting domain-containing protein [Bacteroidota bacterium]
MKLFCSAFLSSLFFCALFAQQTGHFQLEIDFDEADYDLTRTLYFHVPTDYDSATSYPLVVGFRGGPHSNAGQFRTQLTFLADSMQAIILCPENAAHFWNEEGLTKQLFRYAVDTTQAMYNIDPDMIYLTGLSYGGRHSVIVTMDTDDGTIPNIRGVIPFAPGSDSQFQPDYEAVDQFPPACICIGLWDSDNFINVANQLHDDLQNNGAEVLLNEIENVGHTTAFDAFPSEMMECIRFIDGTYEVTNVAEPSIVAEVRVFPNPVGDFLQIAIPLDWEVQKISVTNELGQTLKEFSTTQRSLQMPNWPRGNYWLILDTNQGQVTKPFVLQ